MEVGVESYGNDLRAELHRHGPQLEELAPELLQLLGAYQLLDRELRPGDILAIQEKDRLEELLARCQVLPVEVHKLAWLRNALGKLQAAAGNFAAAATNFQAVCELTADPKLQSEAHANAYLVALERGQFPEALEALKRAVALEPGRMLFPAAKYDPQRILWAAGCGVCFLCKHRNSDSNVAVLTLRPDVLERSVAEVFHEVQVLEELEHPATVRLRDCDFADARQTRPYLVEDYFEGLTLADHVSRHGPLTAEDLFALVHPVADALRAAHASGVLHRNLQPGNLFLRKEAASWRVKLGNFALSLKRSVIRTIAGNPAARSGTILGGSVLRAVEYAAPEQLGLTSDTKLGPAMDVHGFGRLCYFALLGDSHPADEAKEGLAASWQKLLGQCTAWRADRRLPGFDKLLEQLDHPPAPAPIPAAVEVDHRQAPALEAERVTLHHHRGVAHWQRGEHDQAIAEFTGALQVDPHNAGAFQARANAHVSKGEYDQAVGDYTEALRHDARQPLAYVNRGLAYTKLRDPDRAIADYTAAIRLDPSFALAFLNRGAAHARRGEFDRAMVDFNEALRLDPRLALAHVNRGLAHAKKGEHELAIADYDQALELEPANADARARREESARALQARPQRSPPAPPTKGPELAHKRRELEPDLPNKIRVFSGHTDAVRSVAFMPDGRRIISGSEDNTLGIWDAKTANRLARLAGHSAGVTSVACSPRGDRILSGSQDNTVRVWRGDTGEEIRRFGGGSRLLGAGGHSDAVVSVAFSPNGNRVLSAGWDKTVRLWDINTGKELRRFDRHNWLIHSVAFAPDGKHFLYGSEDQTVRLCDLESGTEVRRFQGHGSWVQSVAFSPDGRLVLSGSSDGTLRLWNVSRGKEEMCLGGEMGVVQSVCFSADGRRALSGEYTMPGENTILRLWDLESGLELARYEGHKQMIWSVAFSVDGHYAITGSADRTLRLWHLPT